MKELCSVCPMKLSLDTAEATLDEVEDSHKTVSAREKAYGAIEFQRKLAAKVIEAADHCLGPVYSDERQYSCPHERTVNRAAQYFSGPGNQQANHEAFTENSSQPSADENEQYL